MSGTGHFETRRKALYQHEELSAAAPQAKRFTAEAAEGTTILACCRDPITHFGFVRFWNEIFEVGGYKKATVV